MRARTPRRVAYGLWGLAMAAAVTGFVLYALPASPSTDLFLFEVWPGVLAILFATLGALVVSRQPRNSIGWLLSVNGVLFGIQLVAHEYAVMGLFGPRPLTGAVVALWLDTWLWVPTWLSSLTLLLLLFPNGRLPSRRWRPVAWLAVVSIAYLIIVTAFAPRLDSGYVPVPIDNPFGIEVFRSDLWFYALPFGVAVMLACAVSLVLRSRRAPEEQRRQIRWVGYAGAIVVLVVAANVAQLLAGVPERSFLSNAIWALLLISFAGIPVAAGIAILKYRLYDIDLVISKTVVYGVLAAFITAVYVGIVVGIGAVVGSRGNLLLSILATALIAVAFQPVRERARRLADRLVYGKRATPYEVLSEFAERMAGAYSLEDVLPRLARVLGEGTAAERAEVWLRVGEELQPGARWPPDDGERYPVRLGSGALPELDDVDRTVPVVHRAELLGALAIRKPRGEPLTPTEEKLLGDVASQAGLVLRNSRLVAELGASRQRLVAAQDEERRRLERNLHDGAQQQLVALSVKARLAESLVGRDPDKERELLAQIKVDTQEALENLRDLARGIYPPLLADRGLRAALEAQARKSPVAVEVDPDGVGRYPAEVEATVYFCVLEALQNVAKYAEASEVRVRLSPGDGSLVFRVTDDGRGFDPATAGRGAGLQNMADRVEALGGSLVVSSSPGEGTTISGSIPVRI